MRAGLQRVISSASLGYTTRTYKIENQRMRDYLEREGISFKCRSPMSIIRDLLSKKNLVEDARWHYTEKVDNEGNRIYEHLCNGLWWEKTEKAVPEGVGLVPIILYLDGTWLSKNGRHSAKPISMSLGNFSQAVYNQNASKRVIGYMPPMSGSEEVRKRAHFKREYNRMQHHVLAAMLGEIREVFESGGFTMSIPGRGEQKLIPVMALVVQDHPEGQFLAEVSSGCRFCTRPKNQFSDVDTRSDERVATETEAFRGALIHRIDVSRLQVEAARDELQQASLHAIRPALADLPFGALPGGFLSSLPSDRMHLWWEGLAKAFVGWVVQLVRGVDTSEADGSGKGKGKGGRDGKCDNNAQAGNAKVAELDARFGRLGCKHGDKSIETKRFPNGVSALGKISAYEMLPLLIQLKIVLGVDHALLSTAGEQTCIL
jgi:hypothetical protein